MQVEADVDEADIGSVSLGQPVVFIVDSYPDDTFTGTVEQIRLQPTVTSNVVTYTVIIDTPNPDEKLYPGMTASVTITTQAEKGVVVPIEALNFNSDPSLNKELNISITEEPNPQMMGVWIKTPNGITRKNLAVGINDGINAVVKSGLNLGDTIVLSASFEKSSSNSNAAQTRLCQDLHNEEDKSKRLRNDISKKYYH
jgi:HlyD family secretion protein